MTSYTYIATRVQDEFELVGIVLGLACYNNVLVGAHLPLPAYKKLLGLVSGAKKGDRRLQQFFKQRLSLSQQSTD